MSAPLHPRELRRVTRERWFWTAMVALSVWMLVASAWDHDTFGTIASGLIVVVCVIPTIVEWAERWDLT